MKKQSWCKQRGACITAWVELNPGGAAAVSRRAELSSLQSSLNPTNHVCYCCTGWNKSKWADMGGAELCTSNRRVRSHVGVFMCACFNRLIWRRFTISAHFSLELRIQPTLNFPFFCWDIFHIFQSSFLCFCASLEMASSSDRWKAPRAALCYPAFQHERYQNKIMQSVGFKSSTCCFCVCFVSISSRNVVSITCLAHKQPRASTV